MMLCKEVGYATTVRRKLIDIAGKIVSHSGKIILNPSSTTVIQYSP